MLLFDEVPEDFAYPFLPVGPSVLDLAGVSAISRGNCRIIDNNCEFMCWSDDRETPGKTFTEPIGRTGGLEFQ